MSERSVSSRLQPVAMLIALCLLFTPFVFARDECSAEIHAELQGQDETDDRIRLRFEVDIAVATSCSTVDYDLILEVMLPDMQWKSIRKPRRVEIQDGLASEVVEHQMTADLKLMSHRVMLVGCDGCSTRVTESSEPLHRRLQSSACLVGEPAVNEVSFPFVQACPNLLLDHLDAIALDHGKRPLRISTVRFGSLHRPRQYVLRW
jgi:hypothetical protein